MKNNKKQSARKPARTETTGAVNMTSQERKAQTSPGSAYDLPRFAMARMAYSALGSGGRRFF